MTAYCVCVCVRKTMQRKKRKPKQKENLWPIVSASHLPLSFSLPLSAFVVSKIAIVIWAKISITASMPCHKRNPIPIPIPIAIAGRQAGVHCGQAWRVTLRSTSPLPISCARHREQPFMVTQCFRDNEEEAPLRGICSKEELPGRQFCGSHKTNQANNL